MVKIKSGISVFFSIALLWGLPFVSFSQDIPCGNDWLLELESQRFPEQKANRLSIEKQIETIAEEIRLEGRENNVLYTIPVVVHIVFKGGIENISDAQIYSQLDVLNEDFRRANANRDDTPIDFQSVVADMEIEFCLANTDENGNSTTGITRTQTQFDNIGTLVNGDGRPRIFYSSLGGKDAWDAKKYLNIWVAKIGSGILGMGAPPGTIAEEDGLLVDPRYFGRVGLAALNPPQDQGRTCTHEVGHFLGLKHLWGDEEDSCDADDGVSDTPMQRDPYLGCPAFPQLSCGNRAMFMNFMDYTDDGCQNLFTQGQKARVTATLMSERNELVKNGGLCTVATNNPSASNFKYTLYPNPTTDRIFIEKENATYDGPISIFSIEGKKMSQIVASNGMVYLGDFPKGMYIIKVDGGVFRVMVK